MRRSVPALGFGLLLGGLIFGGSLLSCGDKKPPPKEKKDADVARDAAPARDAIAKAVYTPAQKKRYRRHLATGRRLADARKWGEATREFEKALEVIAMDGRALSELGWAAFQAGDYALARSANHDAVRAATDRNVRAASLYNLGRVAEASGHRDDAARHYRASLELRQNRTVTRQLQGLGKSPPRPGTVSYERCGPARTVDELCPCILAGLAQIAQETGSGARSELSCHREPRQVAGIELLFAGDEIEEWVHLIARNDRGWSSAALLGYVYNPAAFGIHEEFEIARMEIERFGDRDALWVETVQTRSDRDEVRDEIESGEVRQLTLCSRAKPDDDLVCVLQLPLYERYERSSQLAAAETANAPKSQAIRQIRRLQIDVRDNGTAKVVLIEGDKNDTVAPLLGEHTLW